MRRFLTPIAALLAIPSALAHCPLCTIGAAAAAGGAAYFGVDQAVIGLFIGAFAISIGSWTGRVIKRQFLRWQKEILMAASFLLTVIPILGLMDQVHALPVLLAGEYGGWLNRTYLLNSFLVGSVIGGAMVVVSPSLSAWVTGLRRKQIAYQGIMITFALLVVWAAILQVVM